MPHVPVVGGNKLALGEILALLLGDLEGDLDELTLGLNDLEILCEMLGLLLDLDPLGDMLGLVLGDLDLDILLLIEGDILCFLGI